MKLLNFWRALALATAICVIPAAASAESLSYTYDALGRVASVNSTSGYTINYSYDLAGNRTQVVTTGGVCGHAAVLPLLGGMVLCLP